MTDNMTSLLPQHIRQKRFESPKVRENIGIKGSSGVFQSK